MSHQHQIYQAPTKPYADITISDDYFTDSPVSDNVDITKSDEYFTNAPADNTTNASPNSYVNWLSGEYYSGYNLTEPGSPLERNLKKDGMLIKMEKDGKYQFIREPIKDFYDTNDSFGIIGVGYNKSINFTVEINMKRIKKPLIEIKLIMGGPHGIFASFEDDEYKSDRVRGDVFCDGWFETVHFDVDDEVAFSGGTGTIIKKIYKDTGSIPDYLINKNGKTTKKRADEIIHDPDSYIDIDTIEFESLENIIW